MKKFIFLLIIFEGIIFASEPNQHCFDKGNIAKELQLIKSYDRMVPGDMMYSNTGIPIKRLIAKNTLSHDDGLLCTYVFEHGSGDGFYLTHETKTIELKLKNAATDYINWYDPNNYTSLAVIKHHNDITWLPYHTKQQVKEYIKVGMPYMVAYTLAYLCYSYIKSL